MTLKCQKSECVDLSTERRAASFDVTEFATWWAGGSEKLRQKRENEKMFYNNKEFNDNTNISYLSHQELYEHSIQKATKFHAKLRAQLNATTYSDNIEAQQETLHNLRELLIGPLSTALFPAGNPLRLHFTMFIPALLRLATKEQQKCWLKKAWNCEIIGTYAQTELGHGTFLRGLETRADYDIVNQEFVLNTPKLSSIKWWPGGLGHSANFAIIMAQLYVDGKHYGLHPFLVRIRNQETHKPELGIDVGEIGTKFGCNGLNNGFLGLQNVRIPRNQMLMRNAQVLSDGTFVRTGEPTMTYAAMVYVRVNIAMDASMSVLQAATIATRYAAVRRQSLIEIDQPEPQIINHVTQQAKIFPQIAKGFFFKFAAEILWELYQKVMNEIDASPPLATAKYQPSRLPELHALSCCLKALCSSDGASAIEILRLSCGGQGYLMSSNLPFLYSAATAACTYEGENTVLLLQTARFLLKSFVDVIKRKYVPPSVEYLRNAKRVQWSNKMLTLVQAMEYTAAQKIRTVFDSIQDKKKLYGPEIAANELGIQLTQAALLHGRAFLMRMALEETKKRAKNVSSNLSAIFEQLLELFLLESFLTNLSNVLRYNEFTHDNIMEAEQRFVSVLAKIRPNAVAIVDGFDFHDRVLASTIGSYDGNVYERLLEEARKSSLNSEPVNSKYQSHLSRLMKANL